MNYLGSNCHEHSVVQAEHALAKEMRTLQIHNNDLEAQATALDAQIAKLECARQQVEAHLNDKGNGEDVLLPPEMLDCEICGTFVLSNSKSLGQCCTSVTPVCVRMACIRELAKKLTCCSGCG